jgi:hypothetical protein
MGEKKKKAGRPKANIDWKTVDGLLKAGCTGTEIAAHLGIHPNTLYERCTEVHNCDFSDYLQAKREAGDALLKAAQFQKAVQEKDNTMLVWLGKQRLEQKDKKELDHKNNGGDFEPTQIVFSGND